MKIFNKSIGKSELASLIQNTPTVDLKNAVPKFETVAVASGNDAVITIAADADDFWIIDSITWSYGSTLVPSDGYLKISIDGSIVWQIDVTVSGPGHINFEKPIYGEKNQAVVITLEDGTTGGTLNVRYR